MDQGPNGKRPRTSWSVSSSNGTSLPHPHVSTTPRPHLVHSPPPPHPPSHPHPPPPPHHQAPAPYQQPYPPPRANDHGPGAPAIVPPLHVHTQPQHPELDRRHHEQETLAPMQDHFRQPGHQPQSHHLNQPLSPAHVPYHQYPPRDSLVKRESGDSARRSNSVGNAPDSLPHTPHPSQPHQPALSSGEGQQQRQMGYENGPSMNPTPGVYRPPAYPQPTPTHQATYESQTSYQPVPEPFYSVYTSSASSKKKNTRASQACDQCRQLKAKCDETKPCKTCRDKGTECKYRDPVPKATDKTQSDILEGINSVRTLLTDLMDEVGRMNNRIGKLERSLPNSHNGTILKADPVDDYEVKELERASGDLDADSASNYYGEERRDSSVVDRTGAPIMAEDVLEAEPGPPVAPGEPAIPINHTTLAGLLLAWPSISDITKPHLESQGIRHITEYPISVEQNRGVLIVYGRGEDSHPSQPARDPVDHGQLDMADDCSEAASPSSTADWGHLGGLSPADQAVDYRGGVLACDGNPDFEERKVWSYVSSFTEHILNMHPIIQPHVLQDWVQEFLTNLPTKPSHTKFGKLQSGRGASVAFAVGSTPQHNPIETTGSKRKRSPAADGSQTSSASSTGKSGRPERSMHNALVLTILALGKICQQRDRISDALHNSDSSYDSPSARNGISKSPSQSSPPSLSSHSLSSGLVSPREPDRGFQSRRSSIHGSATGTVKGGLGLKKNYEAVPGLEYFAFATDIIGNQLGAYNNMKTVYACIFAGLYHGQLARPLESFSFIHQAGHKLQVLMRPSLDKLGRLRGLRQLISDPKYNQLSLAFWTCLQLESDLIAELQLPPSGLLSYEDNMPHPNMSMLRGFDQRVLDSYLAQLYLRTHLNSIHRMFYSPDKKGAPERKEELDPKFLNVGLVVDAVSDMRWVAQSFAFKEDDAPADDILSARLRAKYWGAQVITYRPFIKQLLTWAECLKNSSKYPNFFPSSGFREEIKAPVIDSSAKSSKELPESVIEYAKRGIKALIESTRAFHNLGPERPVITNVFGTAHAQWGNLLVLTACFKDDVLHEYVPADLLQTLFQKTIYFLRQSSTATGSLRTDMHILEGVYRDLFIVRGDSKMLTSSFSSNASQQPSSAPMAAPPPVSSAGS